METAYLTQSACVGGTELNAVSVMGRQDACARKIFCRSRPGRRKYVLFAQIVEALIKRTAGNCAVGGVGMAFPDLLIM